MKLKYNVHCILKPREGRGSRSLCVCCHAYQTICDTCRRPSFKRKDAGPDNVAAKSRAHTGLPHAAVRVKVPQVGIAARKDESPGVCFGDLALEYVASKLE